MKKRPQNVYGICRHFAGLTQEEAVDKLHISVRSLADYESGRSVPSDELVCAMIEVYESPELLWVHLKHHTQYGPHLPNISLDELPTAVLKLQKETTHLINVQPDMVEIACDGVIGADESPMWGKVKSELRDLAGAALAVLFTRKEKTAYKAAR